MKGGGGTRTGNASSPRGMSAADRRVDQIWGGSSGVARVTEAVRSAINNPWSTFEFTDEYQNSYRTYEISYSSRNNQYSLRENRGMSSSIVQSYSSLDAAIKDAKKRRLLPKGNWSYTGIGT